MSWDSVSTACVVTASCYVTLAIVAETEPYINEEGEEEYTLSGYLLLTGAYMMKWPFKKLFEWIRPQKKRVTHEMKAEKAATDNENELII